MPVFQFKCESCSAICEYLISPNITVGLDCVFCGSSTLSRLSDTCFYPNKTFCPHDKVLDTEKLKTQLPDIMGDTALRCGGCGTDGSPGKCNSEKKGGCGGGCSCGSGGGCASKKSTNKLNLDLYANDVR